MADIDPSGGISVHRGHCSNDDLRRHRQAGDGTRGVDIETIVEKILNLRPMCINDQIDAGIRRDGRRAACALLKRCMRVCRG